ncbi:MAG: molybdopterin molybdotransferase MoeA [Phycisphaeraceae bacterium]
MTTTTAPQTPAAALAALLDRLEPVNTETLAAHAAAGRVLAEPVRADRDSPAHDVSAMDGYAVRLADFAATQLPIAGEVITGSDPPAMPRAAALRIFTGGCVPAGADAVIRREDVDERPGHIRLRVPADTIRRGQNIRRRGENLTAGATVLDAGNPVHPAAAAALATFGHARPLVHRRVRLAALITGDELLPPTAAPEPWQLRDSNGPALHAMFAHLPWIDWQGAIHVRDALDKLTTAVRDRLASCDALLLTGGVSMGDHDHVPAAVRASGGEVIFHKLPIRPGKPLLAAVGPQGQAILGLPGNPVSVMVTARRFAAAALRQRAGFASADPPRPVVRLVDADDKTIPLWWHRPVRMTAPGEAELVATMGSGDVASTARSDGFIELPPDTAGKGPWPCWPWSVT